MRYLSGIGMTVALVALSGCQSAETRQASPYNDSFVGPKARVRMALEELGVYATPGLTCVRPQGFWGSHRGSLSAYDEPSHNLLKFRVFPAKREIGMPKTADMTRIYKEFNVRANQPMLLTAGGGSSNGWRNVQCKVSNAVFLPEEGKDYDIRLVAPTICLPQVSEIVESRDGTWKRKKVTLTVAERCPDSEDS
ncbi:hypothetical protein [Pinirhizobacter sp.]|jgi:hypothetical protein|uniref:hypothetical protein n=1 Tax=Pinirhizobacter sp. TaxID=2950432 RepID=UPI002F40B4F5